MSPTMRTLIAAALGAPLLAGCASTPTEPPLTAGHPANPDAPAAPLPARSRTLALDDSPPPAVLEPMPAMEHGGTDSGMSGMSGMSGTHHHAASMPGTQHATPATEPGENAAPSAPRWTLATMPATSTPGGAAHEPAHEPDRAPARDGQAGQPDHAGHGGHP